MSKTRKKLAARPKPLPPLVGTEWACRKACERKRAFDLQVKAEVAALALANHRVKKFRPPVPLRSYQCPTCGKWHLTKAAKLTE